MNAAVILYHKQAEQIYKKRWIERCVSSLAKQTYGPFTVFELNYGGEHQFYFPETHGVTHRKFVARYPNHVWAQNDLLDRVFLDEDFDCCFNANVDDYFAHDRFSSQIEALARAELVSSNFQYVREENGQDVIGELKKMSEYQKHIKKELDLSHNVLCHPSICYSRKFWLQHRPYDVNGIPREDWLLWKKAVDAGATVYIVPKVLCFYRCHPQQVTASVAREKYPNEGL